MVTGGICSRPLLLFALAAWPGAAWAVEPLTLAEAQRLALASSPTAGIAQARLDKAQAVRGAAWAALFPSLTFAGTYTRRLQDSEFNGRTVQLADALRADLSLDLTVFDARALAILSATGKSQEAQALESDELRRTLSFSVAAAYYAVLSADSLTSAASRRREAAETTAREAAARFAAGLAAKNDVTRTELEWAVARQEESTTRAAVARARLALGVLVGLESLGDRPLSEPPPLEPTPTADLEAAALAGRQDLAALGKRTEQLSALADEPLYRLIPTLSLRGLLFATNEQGVAGRTLDGNVSATLTWRLFDGGLRYADLASRRADVREAEYRAEDARTRVRQEVRGARISLDEARATLELAELRTRVAEQNAEEVRALFASGLAGALEQVDAAVAEYEARASLARQKVAVRVAELSVLAALGSWPGERINP